MRMAPYESEYKEDNLWKLQGTILASERLQSKTYILLFYAISIVVCYYLPKGRNKYILFE